MEFDSKLQVFGVYVGDIMDSPYMSCCHAGLCSSVVSRFLSSILVFDYNSTLTEYFQRE